MNIDILKVIDQNAKLTTKEIAEMLDKDEKEVATTQYVVILHL
jgi:DNA-binding Lrp family transcriptional regulator